MQQVAVIGASDKPDRYSYKAVRMLLDYGHEVYPVSPDGRGVLGRNGWRSVGDLPNPIDTLTLYVGPRHLDGVIDEVLAMDPLPGRVIFNPGTESEAHEQQLQAVGIDVERACTLVLLSTGQFG